jgi:hemerythrin-like domain-containing protein
MPRFDLFTSIHKAIRAMVYETGRALQTADFADGASAAGAVDRLEPVLVLLAEHHETEEQFVFPVVLPFEPGLVAELQAQHQEVERLLDAMRAALGAVTSADPDSRAGAGIDLNRRYNELTAFYLQHLAHEEVTILPATWEHLDDDRLIAIQGSIMASRSPEHLMQTLGWMFKGLNRMELVGVLSGAKATMPPPALDAITKLGAATMDLTAWEVVRRQAGL